MFQSLKIPINDEIHNYSHTNKYFLPIYEEIFFVFHVGGNKGKWGQTSKTIQNVLSS